MRAYKPQNTPFPKEGCSIESQARRQDQPQSQIKPQSLPLSQASSSARRKRLTLTFSSKIFNLFALKSTPLPQCLVVNLAPQNDKALK